MAGNSKALFIILLIFVLFYGLFLCDLGLCVEIYYLMFWADSFIASYLLVLELNC